MEWILPLTVTCAIVLFAAVSIASLAMIKANEALIEVKAMQRSTHQVQLVPAETLLGGASDDEIGNAAGRIEHENFESIDDIIRDSDSLI